MVKYNDKNAPLLKINNMTVTFTQYDRGLKKTELPVIRDLAVEVRPGETVAVIGSSGSGKSLLAHAVMGVLPYNAEMKADMTYDGELLDKKRIEMLRGNEMVMVPQSLSFLNPLMKIGQQIKKGRNDNETNKRLNNIFEQFELDKKVMNMYPFELSGGMNRRVLVSTALIEHPRLVIADEPTPGLDPAMAKRAMSHFRDMANNGAAVLVITHDLELALETADRVSVFYSGTTIEDASVKDFEKEEYLRHPYTKALWHAMPRNGFKFISGNQSYVKNLPKGCVFSPRCPFKTKECELTQEYRSLRGGKVRCVNAK
ncbi:MAG: ABC transporter ATP-binding protein [Lachnospiraceae bacterium]|nr:ABC transporter ATP-binding protein [Lachnospiraceae bacterium]